MATSRQRHHMADLMAWLEYNRKLIHYAERRPMSTRGLFEQGIADRFHGNQSITMDCSEAVTLICRLAGLADPNGLSYNGAGFTGTMLNHLEHYENPDAAEAGALVVFGPGTGEHVAMVYQAGGNPSLFSHGQEAGPIFVDLRTEARAHKPPVRFLSVGPL